MFELLSSSREVGLPKRCWNYDTIGDIVIYEPRFK